MRKIELAYGEGRRAVTVPEEKLLGIYEPGYLPAVPNMERAVLSTLEKPLGGKAPDKVPRLRRSSLSEKYCQQKRHNGSKFVNILNELWISLTTEPVTIQESTFYFKSCTIKGSVTSFVYDYSIDFTNRSIL